MFSTVTSAFFSISLTISSPRGDLRLSVIDFLLALNWWKYQGSLSGLPGASRRPGSPVFGFSILTTSAPSQASASVQDGPASNCVKSTTRTPSRQSSSTPLAFISRHSSQKQAGTIARDDGRGKSPSMPTSQHVSWVSPGQTEQASRGFRQLAGWSEGVVDPYAAHNAAVGHVFSEHSCAARFGSGGNQQRVPIRGTSRRRLGESGSDRGR